MDLKNCAPVLFSKDAGKSKDFYTGILGMTVIADFGGMNYVFQEGFAVWQQMDENIIVRSLGRENIENPRNTSRFELCFETEDLDAVLKTLKDNNVNFLHEINTEPWGQRTVRFYDPDGHLIEAGEAMHIFLRRIYDEEGRDLEATSRRTFVPVDGLRHFLGL